MDVTTGIREMTRKGTLHPNEERGYPPITTGGKMTSVVKVRTRTVGFLRDEMWRHVDWPTYRLLHVIHITCLLWHVIVQTFPSKGRPGDRHRLRKYNWTVHSTLTTSWTSRFFLLSPCLRGWYTSERKNITHWIHIDRGEGETIPEKKWYDFALSVLKFFFWHKWFPRLLFRVFGQGDNWWHILLLLHRPWRGRACGP